MKVTKTMIKNKQKKIKEYKTEEKKLNTKLGKGNKNTSIDWSVTHSNQTNGADDRQIDRYID